MCYIYTTPLYGTPERTQTLNLRGRNPMLCPVELPALILLEVPVGFEPTILDLQSIALTTWHHVVQKMGAEPIGSNV